MVSSIFISARDEQFTIINVEEHKKGITRENQPALELARILEKIWVTLCTATAFLQYKRDSLIKKCRIPSCPHLQMINLIYLPKAWE